MECDRTASWKLTLEFEFDRNVEISMSGEWSAGMRPADECIAFDMGSLIRMLQTGGNLISVGDAKTVSDAFWDGISVDDD